MIYLNQAGTSWPRPQAVRAAAAEALEASPETWATRLEADHREVARHLGVADAEALLLTPGATSAIAAAFAAVPWRPGDRVVVSGLEHEAVHGPAKRLVGRGVEVDIAPHEPGQPLRLDWLEDTLQRGGVRLVALTAASNVTGERLPVEETIAIAQRHGATVLVDASQTAGWLPLDLPNLGADLVAFAGHKGPQAPWGIGGLYVDPSIGWDRPGFCDVGSIDRAALAGLAAGLRWLDEPPRRDRLERARGLAARLASDVREIPGVRLLSPDPPDMPIVALTAHGWQPDRLAAALMERGLAASGGLQCARLAHETLGTAPDGVLRLSFGPMNAVTDAEDAATALRAVLAAAN